MAWRSPQRKLLRVAGVVWAGLMVTLASQVCCAAPGGPTFPSSGYGNILTDNEDPTVPDNIDILTVGYQKDSAYAYFRITVAGVASLSHSRFFLYFDLDADNAPDRRLLNNSASSTKLESWTGSKWQNDGSGWSQDPDGTPDDHVDFAIELSEVNDGSFRLKAAAALSPSADDNKIRDPAANPDFDEVTGGISNNPTAVEATGFCATLSETSEGPRRVRLCWRLGARAVVAGFNVYLRTKDGDGLRRVNAGLVTLTDETSYVLEDSEPVAGTYELEVVGPDGRSRTVASALSPIR
jgi:hypothetical protein